MTLLKARGTMLTSSNVSSNYGRCAIRWCTRALTFGGLPEHEVDGYLAREETHPTTGLPRRVSGFRVEHAETAAAIFDDVVSRLNHCLRGITKDLASATAMIEFVTDDDPWEGTED